MLHNEKMCHCFRLFVSVHLVRRRQIHAHIQSDFDDTAAGPLERMPAVSRADAARVSVWQLGIIGRPPGIHRIATFHFRSTGLFSFQRLIQLRPSPRFFQTKTFWIAGVRFLTGWMPLLSSSRSKAQKRC